MFIALMLISFHLKASPPSLPFKLTISPAPDSQNIKWSTFESKSLKERNLQIEDKKSLLKDLLKPQQDPYKVVDSTPPDCQAKNLPAPKNQGRLYSFFSSANHVLGVCSTKKARLKTQYLILHCPEEHRVFFIQYFYPSEDPWVFKPVAECLIR